MPVAATPGLVPQVEVSTAPALAVPDDEAAAELLAAGALDEAPVLALGEEEVELELHAARTPSDSAAAAAAAVRELQWKDLFMCSAF